MFEYWFIADYLTLTYVVLILEPSQKQLLLSYTNFKVVIRCLVFVECFIYYTIFTEKSYEICY